MVRSGFVVRLSGAGLCAAIVLGSAVIAKADTGAAEVGPSFACPTPRDPLGQLICSSPALSRTDLAFVQAYQALRQQSAPEQQKALRAEAAGFGRALRATCGIAAPAAPHDPAPPAPGAAASACVEAEYDRQRNAWAERLTGTAREEAARPLTRQIALQRDLLTLGLLGPGDAVDGVYGPMTRAAILAFQETMGLQATGLLGDADAVALEQQALLRPPHSNAPAPAASPGPAASSPRSPWDDFQSEAVAMGVGASAVISPACAVTWDIRNPGMLANATRSYLQSAGAAVPGDDEDQLFPAEMHFLRSEFAARGIHALYASHPAGIDTCRFEVRAYSADIYGRDVAQPLFGFSFDRVTYDKIVWDRFDPDNLPRIVSAFEYASYARERLHLAPDAGTRPAAARPPPPPAPAPTEKAAMSQQGDGIEVAEWAGTSTLTTRPFHVDGPWELQWTGQGFLAMTLHWQDSDRTSVVAMASARAASSSYQPDGGTFYLEVTAAAPWTAKVVRLPGPAKAP